jgi:hypothetical protein
MGVDWTNSDGLEVRFVGPEAGATGAGMRLSFRLVRILSLRL